MLRIIFFLTISFHTYSEEVRFKPHMIDHKFIGCPTNSHCLEEIGKTRQKWKNELTGSSKGRIDRLERIKNQIGAPTAVYVQSNDISKEKHILWDSPCVSHQKNNPRIYIGETFYKKFPNKTKNENLLLPFILLEKGGSYQKYTLPRGEIPLYYEKNAIYLNREEAGIYYGVKIKADGNFQILEPIVTELIPKKVECDLEMIKNYQSQITLQGIYSSYDCRKIWDRKNEKFLTYIYGHTCH